MVLKGSGQAGTKGGMQWLLIQERYKHNNRDKYIIYSYLPLPQERFEDLDCKERSEVLLSGWLPPIEVSRISYGGKVRPHKELSDPHSVRFFSKICMVLPFSFFFRLYNSWPQARNFLVFWLLWLPLHNRKDIDSIDRPSLQDWNNSNDRRIDSSSCAYYFEKRAWG